MVDASGTTLYSYLAGGLLYTEDGPFASDTVTNLYWNGMRTNLSLQQPTGVWTNRFGWDAAKRLTNVTSQAGSFTNEYSAGVVGASGYSSHLIKRLLLPNLSIITNDFDDSARLLGTYLRNHSGVLTNKHEYLYNRASQRTNTTRIDGSTVGFSESERRVHPTWSLGNASTGYCWRPIRVGTRCPETVRRRPGRGYAPLATGRRMVIHW